MPSGIPSSEVFAVVLAAFERAPARRRVWRAESPRRSAGQLQAVLDALDTSAQAIEIPAIESRRRYQRRQVMLDGR